MPVVRESLSRIAHAKRARPAAAGGTRVLRPKGPRPRYRHISAMAPNPHWRMVHQKHDFCEIIVIQRGREQVTWSRPDGTMAEITAATGDLLLYPKGLLHHERTDASDPVETICIAWDGPSGPEVRRVRDREGHVRHMARWLMEAHFQDYPGIDALRQSLLESVLAEVHRLSHLPAEDAAVGRVRGYILGHLNDPISLQDLAEVAGMSRHHFCRRFKALTGRTPMDEVWRLRLVEARSLILSSNLTLTEISEASGFQNPFHFSRKFRQFWGMAPGRLRAKRN